MSRSSANYVQIDGRYLNGIVAKTSWWQKVAAWLRRAWRK